MSGPDKVFPGIAFDGSDSPSAIARDAIQPDVGSSETDGTAPASHPELSASLKDAQLARIAEAEVDGSYTSVGQGGRLGDNDPLTLQAHAPGAFLSSTQLGTGVDS